MGLSVMSPSVMGHGALWLLMWDEARCPLFYAVDT